jgi:hypothetical protein
MQCATARAPSQVAAVAGASRVYCHGEVTAEERGVEAAAGRALAALGARLEVLWGGQTLLHPGDLPFAPQDTPLSYAEFRQAAAERRLGGPRSRGGGDAGPLRVREPLAAPEQLPGLPEGDRCARAGGLDCRGRLRGQGKSRVVAAALVKQGRRGQSVCQVLRDHLTPPCHAWRLRPASALQRPARAGRAADAAAAGLLHGRGSGRGQRGGDNGGAAGTGGALGTRRAAGEPGEGPGQGGGAGWQGNVQGVSPFPRSWLPHTRCSARHPSLAATQGMLPSGGASAPPAPLRGASPKLFAQLSPWLALGCVSPRSLFRALQPNEPPSAAGAAAAAGARGAPGEQEQEAGAPAGPEQRRVARAPPARDGGWLVFELLWRDYFRFVNYRLAQEAPATAAHAQRRRWGEAARRRDGPGEGQRHSAGPSYALAG